MNGLPDNKSLYEGVEARRNKSHLNKAVAIEELEKQIVKLQMAVDRYYEYSSPEAKENVERQKFEAEVKLDLFEETSLHPDKEFFDKCYKLIQDMTDGI